MRRWARLFFGIGCYDAQGVAEIAADAEVSVWWVEYAVRKYGRRVLADHARKMRAPRNRITRRA